jgi:hypothetical protein
MHSQIQLQSRHGGCDHGDRPVPGGQNVDKVATKVDLRLDLGAIEGLSDAARAQPQGLIR